MVRQATFGVAALAVVAAATASFVQFFALEYLDGEGAGFVPRPLEGPISSGTRFLLASQGCSRWWTGFKRLMALARSALLCGGCSSYS